MKCSWKRCSKESRRTSSVSGLSFCSRSCNSKHWVDTKRRERKAQGVEILGGKCCICGYNKSNWALQFHHKDPKNKKFSITANLHLTWDEIKEEILKCSLLCANCHAEHHHSEAYLSK